MVNGASTPSSSFSLALPSTHPHSSSPTISSTPTLPPTHLRDCGCCSIIATPHISTSLPLQTLIQRGIFFSSKLAVCVTKLKQGQTKKSHCCHCSSCLRVPVNNSSQTGYIMEQAKGREGFMAYCRMGQQTDPFAHRGC